MTEPRPLTVVGPRTLPPEGREAIVAAIAAALVAAYRALHPEPPARRAVAPRGYAC
jgi:hypothetical protein